MARYWLSAALAALTATTIVQPTFAEARSDHRSLRSESDRGFLPQKTRQEASMSSSPNDASILEETFSALVVLQDEYFDNDYGTWLTAIDWTGAVTQTVIAGVLTTLSTSLETIDLQQLQSWKDKENLISYYYAQLVAIYFGQDILSMRGQGFDDILWVVLGWIEALKFVQTHSRLHYGNNTLSRPDQHDGAFRPFPWHGQHWLPSFAHRARIFWNLGSRGWDTKLCEGGMLWSRRLSPYKNAITNELWVSSSISMYRHFIGDNFTAPWLAGQEFSEKDPEHLAAAIEGYKWLKNVNMTNAHGLYVDGYHISHRSENSKCDLRDEMVYTYNQGVILTGLRELWISTGSESYLADGHALLRSVVQATGWDTKASRAIDIIDKHGRLPRWHGIGRGGLLEEQCDASGTCSQDGQSFKGIFFHHLTSFCAPIDETDERMETLLHVAKEHIEACSTYLGWVRHNANAALLTRDESGRFGMWWGAEIFGNPLISTDEDGINHSAENTTDYRNEGTPRDGVWGRREGWSPEVAQPERDDGFEMRMESEQQRLEVSSSPRRSSPRSRSKDPNERGRGRTVETQVGGLALLRAYWELSRLASNSTSRS